MLSFAVTAFQEMSSQQLGGERIRRCIKAAQEHDAVGEIVIVDDRSRDFARLENMLADEPKVLLFQNPSNYGVFTNKLEAVALSSGEWVITCDSDNVMDAAYIDWIASTAKQDDTWYCPSFAKPAFDYRSLVGTYDLATIGDFLTRPMSHCAMNTGNQVVHRDRFISIFGRFRGIRRFDLLLPNYLGLPEFKRQSEPSWLAYGACDSFLFNMFWLLDSNRLAFVSELQYEHHVHKDPQGSNYARAPAFKVELAGKLVEELKAASSQAKEWIHD